MISALENEATQRMAKSIESLLTEFNKMRTGRAHASLLDHVVVSYYGQEVPLSQVASISVGDARTLLVTPWEKTLIPTIEKAIMVANLGLNPVTSGTTIRVPLPALNEERRKEMIKMVKAEAENGRIAIRNIRRDINMHVKDLLKKKEMTEDDERRAMEAIQKLTDKYIAEVDKHLAAKEKELMVV